MTGNHSFVEVGGSAPWDVGVELLPLEVDLLPVVHLGPQLGGVLLERHDAYRAPVGVPINLN